MGAKELKLIQTSSLEGDRERERERGREREREREREIKIGVMLGTRNLP